MTDVQREAATAVADIMSSPVEFLSADSTVQAAAVLMGELDLGALPVGAPGDLQGILTDRDILFRVVADNLDPVGVKVREVMSSTVFTCRTTDTLPAALDLMSGYQVRRLPVVDDAGTVAGIVTLTDVARALLSDSGVIRDAVQELSAAAQ
jgi:CBS domain-containing protein